MTNLGMGHLSKKQTNNSHYGLVITFFYLESGFYEAPLEHAFLFTFFTSLLHHIGQVPKFDRMSGKVCRT